MLMKLHLFGGGILPEHLFATRSRNILDTKTDDVKVRTPETIVTGDNTSVSMSG